MPYINETWIGVPRDLKDYLDSKKPEGATWAYWLHYLLEFYLQNNKLLPDNK